MLHVKSLVQWLMMRDFAPHSAELHVRIGVLNGYTTLGMPTTEPLR